MTSKLFPPRFTLTIEEHPTLGWVVTSDAQKGFVQTIMPEEGLPEGLRQTPALLRQILVTQADAAVHIARDVKASLSASPQSKTQLSAAHATFWQPIATAPKDKRVDLWVLGRRWPDCRWDAHAGVWMHRDTLLLDSSNPPNVYWMPIPAGPDETA